MDMNVSMSVQNAIEIFTTIMRSLNTVDKQIFLSFVADNWKPQEIKIQSVSNGIYNAPMQIHNDKS